MDDHSAFEARGGFPAELAQAGLNAALLADLYDALFCYGEEPAKDGIRMARTEEGGSLRVSVFTPPHPARIIGISCDGPASAGAHLFTLKDGRSLVHWHKGVTVAQVRAFIKELDVRLCLKEGCYVHGLRRFALIRDVAGRRPLHPDTVFNGHGRIALMLGSDAPEDPCLAFTDPSAVRVLVKTTSGNFWLCRAPDAEEMLPKVERAVRIRNAQARIHRERGITAAGVERMSTDALRRILAEAVRRADDKDN